MKYRILYNENVEVYQDNNLFLTAKIRNFLTYRMEYFYKGELILKTRVLYFGFFRKTKILYQKLSFPITKFEQLSSFEFMLIFNDNIIRTKQNPFAKEFFKIFLNDIQVAYVTNPKGIHFGSYLYDLHSDIEDEFLNLLFILALLIQMIH